MKSYIISAVVVVVAILALAMWSVNSQKKTDETVDSLDRLNDSAVPVSQETEIDGTGTNPIGEAITVAGSYEAYATEKLALAENGDVVLFFHASWCPSCRALNSDIEDNLSDIPSEVTILKVDYDTETALKQKYGVTYQHTMVQVDKDGNMIKKWNGGSTLDSVISEI